VAARDDLLAKADALDDEALEASGANQDELRKRAAGLRVEALGAKPYPVLVCSACFSLTGWLGDDGVCAEDAMRRQQDGSGGFVDIRDDRPRYEDAPAPVGRRVARALGLGRRRDRAREWLMWIEPGATGPVDPEEGWEIEAPISFEQPAPSGPHLLGIAIFGTIAASATGGLAGPGAAGAICHAFLAAGGLATLGALVALAILPKARHFLPKLHLSPHAMPIH
jgi:hypothetical protein